MRQKMFRKRSYIENDALTTTDSNVVLFTAQEACTLRRIIATIIVTNDADSSNSVTNFSIEVAPNGVVVNSAFGSQALDVDVSQEYLGGGVLALGATNTTVSGFLATDKVQWESKGMRKMRKGDQLIISHTSDLSGGDLNAYFDIFLSL